MCVGEGVNEGSSSHQHEVSTWDNSSVLNTHHTTLFIPPNPDPYSSRTGLGVVSHVSLHYLLMSSQHLTHYQQLVPVECKQANKHTFSLLRIKMVTAVLSWWLQHEAPSPCGALALNQSAEPVINFEVFKIHIKWGNALFKFSYWDYELLITTHYRKSDPILYPVEFNSTEKLFRMKEKWSANKVWRLSLTHTQPLTHTRHTHTNGRRLELHQWEE